VSIVHSFDLLRFLESLEAARWSPCTSARVYIDAQPPVCRVLLACGQAEQLAEGMSRAAENEAWRGFDRTPPPPKPPAPMLKQVAVIRRRSSRAAPGDTTPRGTRSPKQKPWTVAGRRTDALGSQQPLYVATDCRASFFRPISHPQGPGLENHPTRPLRECFHQEDRGAERVVAM
jgi:hypothetical protein